MSRIGRMPITIPTGVTVNIDSNLVTITGPKGSINVVVPFYFLYGDSQNKLILKDRALEILEQMQAENNRLITRWRGAGIVATNALESQALLQLQRNYCEQRRCLECTIGHKIIVHEPV